MAANSHSLDLELTSSQYASRADTASLSILDDISIAAWVRVEQLPSTSGTSFGICCKGDSGANTESWVFFINNSDKLSFIWSLDGGSINRTIFTADAATFAGGDVGAWVHVAITADVGAKTATMYKNGVSIASTKTTNLAAAIFDGNGSVAIGALPAASPTFFFDGMMDEVVVTSDIMSSGEVSDLYAGWSATEKVNNIAAYWKLNNDYTDSSGNSNTLTASGSPVFSTTVPFANYASASGDFGSFRFL